MTKHTTTAVAALALFTSAGLAQTSTWNITTDGFWSVPTNWSPVIAPITSTSDAFIPNNGSYTISISGNFSTDDITNSNPSATIALNASRVHTLFGNLDNEGVYLVNPNNGAAQTTLIWDNNAIISGSGTIELNGFTTRARLVADTGATITHGANHTIHGFGQIFGDFVNDGAILADNPFNTLDFRFGNVTNNNLIGATNNGILSLNFIDLVITQSPSGVVRADNAEVTMNQPTIIGGTVEGINGGAVVSDGFATFDDVTINGNVEISVSRTLNLADTITNNGTITVNPTNGAAATTLDADNNVLLTGPGKVTLNGFTTRAQITTAGGGTLTNDTNHTIEGFGRIFGTLINDGTTTANNPGQTLLLVGNDKTNNGTMSADGGILELNGFTLDQSGGGTLDAIDGQIRHTNATTIAGTLESAKGLHIVADTSTFNAVTNNANVSVNAGQRMDIGNSITNNSTITVNPTNGAANTIIQFTDDGALNGNGSVVLNGFTTRSQVSSADSDSFTVTNGANHIIRGFGQITTPMVNDGHIIADVPGQELRVLSNGMQNSNTIQATNGATLELGSNSSMTQAPGAKVAADNATVELSATAITGGSLESTGSGSFITISSSSLTSVTNNAALNINAAQILRLGSTHTNNALIDVNPTNGAAVTLIELQNSMTIDGPGEIRLSGFTTRAQITGVTDTEVVTLGPDQTLSGIGNLQIELVNNGTVAPGLSVGTLNAFNDFTMGASGVYACEVAANNNADLINLPIGMFNAGGTLDVSFINGFDPANIWTAQIVSAPDGITGEFDTIIAPASPNPFFTFRVGYFDDEIRIGFVCDADYDLSGDLDFFDISTFLMLFNNGRPAADITGDGEYDFFDISAFLQLFTNGCGE